VNWVLERTFVTFGQLDHFWLRKFVEHRIAAKRILRLIDKSELAAFRSWSWP
jgi:RNA-directed DNA polymerase